MLVSLGWQISLREGKLGQENSEDGCAEQRSQDDITYNALTLPWNGQRSPFEVLLSLSAGFHQAGGIPGVKPQEGPP